MRYIVPNSTRGLVNKFADYIVSHLDPNKNNLSFVEVTYHNSFFVVVGKTERENLLDINELKQSFFDSNSKFFEELEIKSFNVIDLLEYNQKLVPINYTGEFYNSDYPVLNSKVIDFIGKNDVKDLLSIDYMEKLILETHSNNFHKFNEFTINSTISITSEFPYGYSLKIGRICHYYFENISYQVLNKLGTDKIWFKAQTGLTENGDLNIKMDSTSYYPNEKIKSMILDIFDFNYNKFKNENLTDFEYTTQIETQLEKSNWVNLKDFSELNLF
jgi:hypothetical protein